MLHTACGQIAVTVHTTAFSSSVYSVMHMFLLESFVLFRHPLLSSLLFSSLCCYFSFFSLFLDSLSASRYFWRFFIFFIFFSVRLLSAIPDDNTVFVEMELIPWRFSKFSSGEPSPPPPLPQRFTVIFPENLALPRKNQSIFPWPKVRKFWPTIRPLRWARTRSTPGV